MSILALCSACGERFIDWDGYGICSDCSGDDDIGYGD